jgi:BirA family biotin operon repressor/biotin-[acetyl-CoA-carboxylase] ligase
MNSTADVTVQWAEARQMPVHFTVETGSTSDDAKSEALQTDREWHLYVTSHQTKGRGRGSNQWKDTGPGDALLCTWSCRMVAAPQAITAPRIGLSVFLAASKTWPSLNWSLKAPNDLYLSGKKVGGLLVESVTSGDNHRLLVGFGLNVNNHPRALDAATHLGADLGHSPDEAEWFQFLDELKAQLGHAVSDIIKPKLSAQVCSDLRNALNANAARPFTVTSISPEGDLLLDSGGVKRWTEL